MVGCYYYTVPDQTRRPDADLFDLLYRLLNYQPTLGREDPTPADNTPKPWGAVLHVRGFAEDDLTVKVDEGRLTVRGVAVTGDEGADFDRREIQRHLNIPENVDLKTLRVIYTDRCGGKLIVRALTRPAKVDTRKAECAQGDSNAQPTHKERNEDPGRTPENLSRGDEAKKGGNVQDFTTAAGESPATNQRDGASDEEHMHGERKKEDLDKNEELENKETKYGDEEKNDEELTEEHKDEKQKDEEQENVKTSEETLGLASDKEELVSLVENSCTVKDEEETGSLTTNEYVMVGESMSCNAGAEKTSGDTNEEKSANKIHPSHQESSTGVARKETTDPDVTNVQDVKDIVSDDLQLTFDLTSYDPSNIRVELRDGRLVVEATQEEETGSFVSRQHFYKNVAVPDGFDVGAIKCGLSQDGQLKITVPARDEETSQPKTIPIDY